MNNVERIEKLVHEIETKLGELKVLVEQNKSNCFVTTNQIYIAQMDLFSCVKSMINIAKSAGVDMPKNTARLIAGALDTIKDTLPLVSTAF